METDPYKLNQLQQQPVPNYRPPGTPVAGMAGTPAPQKPAPTMADPFAAQGGGVWTGTGWLPQSHPGAGGSSASTSMTSTSGGGPNAGQIGMTSSTPNVTPATGQTVQSSFRNALLGQLGTDPNNISLTDPSLAPQMQAFQGAQQRSQERAQQELAEQGFVGGTGRTGAYGAELGAMEQQRGEAEAQYGAGLIGQEKQQRLDSLFKSLGLAGEQLTADEALRLQRELGLGDLNVRTTANANDYRLGQGQLGLGLLSTMLNDRQANNSLGLQAGTFGAGLNQNAVLKMLGLG